MTTEQIKSLFPLKAKVTQEIINEGHRDRMNRGKCIGARSLKSVLSPEIHNLVEWRVMDGNIYTYKPVLVYADKNPMRITAPTEIEFYILN